MCGIVGIIGTQEVAPLLIDGLRRLEYRGYDSAGIATLSNGTIVRVRAEGKLQNLADKLTNGSAAPGTLGIGHTRWATHGIPNEANAHPHATADVAIVHNGIIENYAALKTMLEKKGCVFVSQTDSEVVAHLITDYLHQKCSPRDAVRRAVKDLHGAFALAILFRGEDNLLAGARKGSPLAIGYGDGEMYVGSDALALAPLTQNISYLDEGDTVFLTRTAVEIFDAHDRPATRAVVKTQLSGALIGKGNHRHFMAKEIHEQPAVIGDTLSALINPVTRETYLPEIRGLDWTNVERISLVGCGTAHYAGLTALYWLEEFSGLPVDAHLASEFRYRKPFLNDTSLVICVTQSGETADTLAALRYAQQRGAKVLSVVNVPTSTVARESDAVMQTLAGPEIGVASTKAFTTQLATLACLSIGIGRARGTLSAVAAAPLIDALLSVPEHMRHILEQEKKIIAMALALAEHAYVPYLGRGSLYPIALEGALKLKEISYIHAEGYAAGELKHGTIALIEEGLPVIALCPSNNLFDKTASNLQEVKARGASLYLFSDAQGITALQSLAHVTFDIPAAPAFINPLLYTVPLQLLAYHAAVAKGTDVDQPRNLAKSVTVE